LEFLSEAETIIGHNILKFDLPVLKKLYDFEYDGELIDTLVVSRLLYPDRPKPKGYIGKANHSISAWGYRVGRGKPDHNEWDRFSPEMLHRCREDVLITELVYYELLKEMKK